MAGSASPPESQLLKLRIGTTVQVDCEDKKLKYLTHLVGINSNKAIITALPDNKQIQIAEVLGVRQPLIMRILGEGIVYAFKTSVLGVHKESADLLVSSFPETIQSRVLRQETRYACTLAAELTMGELTCHSLLTNISMGGSLCQLLSADNDEVITQAEKDKAAIKITIVFPFLEEKVYIQGNVRSISKAETGYLTLGISFAETSSVVKTFIDTINLDRVSVGS